MGLLVGELSHNDAAQQFVIIDDGTKEREQCPSSSRGLALMDLCRKQNNVTQSLSTLL